MQFRRIVVGVEFSGASLAAARWAATQLAPEAEVVLAHVLGAPAGPSFLAPYLPRPGEVGVRTTPGLLGGLRGLADVIGAARTRVRVLAGPPADALAALAQEVDADLICLGRRRRRRGAARFGHTTAQRLLARTRTPVLVVPAARAAPPARVLAAIDDQPGRRATLGAARGLAHAHAARLDVLHVLAPEVRDLVCARPAADLGIDGVPLGADSDAGPAAARPALRDEAQLTRLTRAWVDGHRAGAGETDCPAESHARIGDAGEEVVKFAHANAGVDLVVLGRGGEESACGTPSATSAPAPPPGGHPLGSTARLVLWAAPCPVLVLPPAPRAAAHGGRSRPVVRARSRAAERELMRGLARETACVGDLAGSGAAGRAPATPLRSTPPRLAWVPPLDAA